MNTEHATGELFAALAVAQSKIENATKGSKNPHFKSSYADLAEILNTARPVFAAEGLSMIQAPSFDGAMVSVTTLVGHKGGGYITSVASCVPAKSDAQGIGAATTYLRRYSLAAMTGIAQEDDDGNAAAHSTPPAPVTAISPTAGVWESMSIEQQAKLTEIAANVVEYLDMGDANGAWQYLNGLALDTQAKVGLWTRLNSKQRSAIKKAEQEAA